MAKNILKRIAGEISKLRQDISSQLGWNIVNLSSGSVYKLNSSKVDYDLTKQLYNNTLDDYKLGAGFAKPVINSVVGFMGVPHFQSEDEDAQTVLNEFADENVSRMLLVHRNASRDGDCYVWVTREEDQDPLYPEIKTRLIFNIIPPKQVADIICDPVTNRPIKYILKSSLEWQDEQNKKYKAKITQSITAESRIVTIEGDIPPGLEPGEHHNQWGFIPIVHFKNEADVDEKYGTSDLEAIEPYMKVYHDISLHAIQGNKMHSTPRIKMNVTDVARFLLNNFGIEDVGAFIAGGGTIDIDGKELLFFGEGEDGSYMEVSSATGDAQTLLKLIFYCIIDTSETPEFVFGVHTPSSLSSVKEQMPIMVRKVMRKREFFSESWQRLARIVLAMNSKAAGQHFGTYKVTLEWDEVDPRDDKELAETLDKVTSALNTALSGSFISLEAAVDFLGQYVETMSKYISDDEELPGERERIMKTQAIRANIGDGVYLQKQLVELNKELDVDE